LASGRADAVLAAQLTRLGARFALLQYLDDLFFVKSAVLHSLSSFRNFRCFGKPNLVRIPAKVNANSEGNANGIPGRRRTDFGA